MLNSQFPSGGDLGHPKQQVACLIGRTVHHTSCSLPLWSYQPSAPGKGGSEVEPKRVEVTEARRPMTARGTRGGSILAWHVSTTSPKVWHNLAMPRRRAATVCPSSRACNCPSPLARPSPSIVLPSKRSTHPSQGARRRGFPDEVTADGGWQLAGRGRPRYSSRHSTADRPADQQPRAFAKTQSEGRGNRPSQGTRQSPLSGASGPVPFGVSVSAGSVCISHLDPPLVASCAITVGHPNCALHAACASLAFGGSSWTGGQRDQFLSPPLDSF